MRRRPTDFAAVLKTLKRHAVRFVLVGGVAAVIEGAPLATFDIDIVPERGVRNIERLQRALVAMRARYRSRPTLPPDPETLRGPGRHLLATDHGPLDVLGMIGEGRDFQALLPHSRWRTVAGSRIRVLDLETQIGVKEELAFAKDRAIVPLLKETLRLRQKR